MEQDARGVEDRPEPGPLAGQRRPRPGAPGSRRRRPASSPAAERRPGLVERRADGPDGRLPAPAGDRARPGSGQSRTAWTGGRRRRAGSLTGRSLLDRRRRRGPVAEGPDVALADGSGRSGRGIRRSGRRTSGSCRGGRGARPSSSPRRRRAARRPAGAARPRPRGRGRGRGRSRRSAPRRGAGRAGRGRPTARAPALAGQLGEVGRAEAAGADRLGELRLELPLALAEPRLVPGQGDRPGVGDDLAARP